GLGVSTDGTVHAFFGDNNVGEIYYYQRNTAGQWVIQGEQVTGSGAGDVTAGASSNGVPMAAWKGPSPGGNTDIYAATRNSNGTWTVEDISYSCCLPDCPTTSKTYLPALAADSSGGMRASWSDEHCD